MIEIREATEEDIPNLQLLNFFNEDYKNELQDFFKGMFFNENYERYILYIALLDKEIIGFISLESLDKIERNALHLLFVKPDHRRKSIATKLISRVEFLNNIHRCRAQVTMSDYPSQSLLLKLGYWRYLHGIDRMITIFGYEKEKGVYKENGIYYKK